MNNGKTYPGSCFCGAVQFTVSGEPDAMGYCHCDSCRHWSAGPVNAFTLWKPEAVQVTQGAESIGTYNKTPPQLPQMVQNLRRPSLHRASDLGAYGCVCGSHSRLSVPPRHSCELSGDGAAHQGWIAEDEGSSARDGGLGCQCGGITRKRFIPS